MEEGKILIVDDEKEIGELIQLYLEKNGYQIFYADNGHQALEVVKQERPDLIILDLSLPDTNGVEICREIRKGSDVPIIILSVKRGSDDIILGLDTGADDYITKPFDPRIVVARVKANLRRALKRHNLHSKDHIARYGDLEFDLQSYDVKFQSHSVPLSIKERQLLFFLIEHPNQVFSVEQLYENIWGWDSDSNLRTVMVHISNLRRKIESDPANPKYIQTVRGFGYKFLVEDH
ncbi:response regulator transcription factor [Effusibacillus dendaii]|uniref:DNA-binding response regulator n=1 Tax=Effusibacillus dendaii TaxID=2743772 RepID=A0A7I8D7E1_9BACL|nr:response regulator transcription factor [Effusibacillus dendaii]BCJ86014.1 DNA-binding response regulator [Effusibacillus dendaii]